jgi:hypothetical protein
VLSHPALLLRAAEVNEIPAPLALICTTAAETSTALNWRKGGDSTPVRECSLAA